MNDFDPSPIWEAVEGGESYANFCANIIPDFRIAENVPDSLKKRFNIIRKLLEFSYYEYQFIDVAMERCYLTLELALNLKYQEVYPAKKKKMSLKPLLDWAVREGHLSISVEQK